MVDFHTPHRCRETLFDFQGLRVQKRGKTGLWHAHLPGPVLAALVSPQQFASSPGAPGFFQTERRDCFGLLPASSIPNLSSILTLASDRLWPQGIPWLQVARREPASPGKDGNVFASRVWKGIAEPAFACAPRVPFPR
jgi:hypothetical protein